MNSVDFADFRAKRLVKSVEKFASNLISGSKHTLNNPGDDLSCLTPSNFLSGAFKRRFLGGRHVVMFVINVKLIEQIV